MYKLLLLLGVVLCFSSCSSASQEAQEQLFDGAAITKGQKALSKLALNSNYEVNLDAQAPRCVVEDSVWTDPCKLLEDRYTTASGTSEYEKGYVIENLRCAALEGPWIATFVNYVDKSKSSKPVPALVRPSTRYSSHTKKKSLTLLQVYLNYDSTDPIRLFVELE